MSRPVEIKVCGITNADDALCAVELGVRFLGFNFYPKSPRYIAPGDARAIIRRLPAHVLPVGVFVNEKREEIEHVVAASEIRAVQLHGDESPEDCANWQGLTLLKAFRLDEHGVTRPPLAAYQGLSGWYLVDRFVPGTFGGTGKSVPPEVVCRVFPPSSRSRLFVAGGLTPENVADTVRSIQPGGVDVAGGVEGEIPGRKDPARMKQFVAAVRSVEEAG